MLFFRLKAIMRERERDTETQRETERECEKGGKKEQVSHCTETIESTIVCCLNLKVGELTSSVKLPTAVLKRCQHGMTASVIKS